VVTQRAEAIVQGWEAVPVGEPLVFLPAGTDPSSKRPPEMTSIVEAILAVSAGLRKPVQMTMWPIRARDVACASAASIVNDSKVISWSAGHGGEVVEHPDRLEAERLGLPGPRDRGGPGVRCLPAVELALPTLGTITRCPCLSSSFCHHHEDHDPARVAARAPARVPGFESASPAVEPIIGAMELPPPFDSSVLAHPDPEATLSGPPRRGPRFPLLRIATARRGG